MSKSAGYLVPGRFIGRYKRRQTVASKKPAFDKIAKNNRYSIPRFNSHKELFTVRPGIFYRMSPGQTRGGRHFRRFDRMSSQTRGSDCDGRHGPAQATECNLASIFFVSRWVWALFCSGLTNQHITTTTTYSFNSKKKIK